MSERQPTRWQSEWKIKHVTRSKTFESYNSRIQGMHGQGGSIQ